MDVILSGLAVLAAMVGLLSWLVMTTHRRGMVQARELEAILDRAQRAACAAPRQLDVVDHPRALSKLGALTFEATSAGVALAYVVERDPEAVTHHIVMRYERGAQRYRFWMTSTVGDWIEAQLAALPPDDAGVTPRLYTLPPQTEQFQLLARMSEAQHQALTPS